MRALFILALFPLFTHFSVGATETDNTMDATTEVPTSSEYQHQTPLKTLEVLPSFSYGTSTSRYNGIGGGTPSTSNTDIYTYGAQAEYGISRFVSLGLRLTYVTAWNSTKPSTSQSTTHQVGLNDPELYANGRYDFGNAGSLRFGTAFGFGLTNQTVDFNGNTNAMDGGVYMRPFAGYEIALGRNIIGARMSFQFYIQDPTITFSDSSGDVLSMYVHHEQSLTSTVFYEFHLQPVIFGAAVGMTNDAKQTVTSDSGQDSTSNSDTRIMVSGYVPWDITSKVRLLPEIDYTATTAYDFSSNSYPPQQLNFQIAARFAF